MLPYVNIKFSLCNHDGDMTKAGKALKMVLEIYGINQNQLAIAMGIGRSSINRWVKENRDPVANAVLEIRKGLREINPEAAEKFIQLYLDESVEEEPKKSLKI
jgi:transcriptional regulator with XRE-family HTH domain